MRCPDQVIVTRGNLQYVYRRPRHTLRTLVSGFLLFGLIGWVLVIVVASI